MKQIRGQRGVSGFGCWGTLGDKSPSGGRLRPSVAAAASTVAKAMVDEMEGGFRGARLRCHLRARAHSTPRSEWRTNGPRSGRGGSQSWSNLVKPQMVEGVMGGIKEAQTIAMIARGSQGRQTTGEDFCFTRGLAVGGRAGFNNKLIINMLTSINLKLLVITMGKISELFLGGAGGAMLRASMLSVGLQWETLRATGCYGSVMAIASLTKEGSESSIPARCSVLFDKSPLLSRW